MSYSEQKWTVDKVNEKILGSDFGKDLYIIGIPRVFTPEIRKISGSSNYGESLVGSVNGSGFITNISVSAYSHYATSVSTDVYVVFKYGGMKYKVPMTATASGQGALKTNELTIKVDNPFVRAPNDGVYLDNTIFNGIIPFDEGFDFYVAGHSNYPSVDRCSGTIEYILK